MVVLSTLTRDVCVQLTNPPPILNTYSFTKTTVSLLDAKVNQKTLAKHFLMHN